MPDLLTLASSAESAESVVWRSARVLRTFDQRTQDSGNVSWLVEHNGRALFIKTAGEPEGQSDGRQPFLDHDGRVALLNNAVELARSCSHPSLAVLRNVVATGTGPALVYDAAPGELIGVPRDQRADPGSAYRRFSRLPGARMMAIFDNLIDLHVALAGQGWVACDLYDGCLIVATDDRLTVIDLDSYRRGPFVNTMGRLFGSDRFMAPEEKTLGAAIDQRTTVFTLGRLVTHFGTRLTESLDRFAGSAQRAEVLLRACRPKPGDRYATVAAFGAAWVDAAR